MFVINPDPYSLPCYRIGPFQTRDISKNHLLPDSDLIDEYFDERFAHKQIVYTENGRKAIHLALGYYKLNREDVVTILTTTGNFYISGCVTTEIEKFCRWSREIVPETKILFVNHEFGFPYQGLSNLKKYKLPIIEDCAGSFFSHDSNYETVQVGDFAIYSFPKMFPLQVGGILKSNLQGESEIAYQLDNEYLRHIKNVLSNYIRSKDDIIKKRVNNYKFLVSKFEPLGLTARFQLNEGIVPGVFMFRTDKHKIDLPELKKFFYAHGVQCSVFYGEDAFFIPVHQELNEQDMEYFYKVANSFINKYNI
jgi:hypothetical protein